MLSRMRSHIQSWWQQTPLPMTAATPSFQQWYHFDQEHWIPYFINRTSQPDTEDQWIGSFRLVTWNVNADGPLPKSRISALLHVIQTTAAADVLFLQEVSRDALTTLLENSWVQKTWYTSDTDISVFGSQKFINIALVSKNWVATNDLQLGAIWRAALPSRFGRNTLCCDVIFNASSKHSAGKRSLRIRLINVHLDSLPINPSLRPQQLAICTSYLRAAGCGVIAGDFNPLLCEDEDLLSTNGLVDAWVCLQSNDPGYTWGVHGEQVFPPNRLDKVAMLGLTPSAVGILGTKMVECCSGEMAVEGVESGSKVQFSDHLGVWCDVKWREDWTEK